MSVTGLKKSLCDLFNGPWSANWKRSHDRSRVGPRGRPAVDSYADAMLGAQRYGGKQV